MILSPFVFLHLSPHPPHIDLQEDSQTTVHAIPIEFLPPFNKKPRTTFVDIDIASRLAPDLVQNMLEKMSSRPVAPTAASAVFLGEGAASMTSIFPRFSIADVNLWIWVFGKRYRDVVRGWEASMAQPGTNDKRINWSGSALNAFYGAVRRALVVVIILRALGLLGALAGLAWWLLHGR
ncbi:hypothetical protein RSAG8_01638, partial [Rhizoctonia solani AG-8 WAC10335]